MMLIFNLFSSWGKCPKLSCTLYFVLAFHQMSFQSVHASLPSPTPFTGVGNNFTELMKMKSSSEDNDNTQVQSEVYTSCCTKGKFCYEKEFFNLNYILESTLGETLEAVYVFTLFHCLIIPAVSEVVFGEYTAICDCDCYFAHGASKFKVCHAIDVPCLCLYTEEDKSKIPDLNSECKLPSPKYIEPPPVIVSQDEPFLQPEHKSNGSKLEGLDGVCEDVFAAAGKFICDDINDNGNDFYTLGEFKIYPADICSLDCFYTHGSHNNSPYGECCNMEDGTKMCICLG